MAEGSCATADDTRSGESARIRGLSHTTVSPRDASMKPQSIENKNPVADDGNTALHCAAEGGHLELLGLFLNYGVDRRSMYNGKTPIHVAASYGHFRSCLFLMGNLKDIVSLIRSNFGKDGNIILITPPPVCHDGRIKFQKERYKDKATGELERTLELSGKYAEGVKDVANELNLPCLDLWTKMQFTSEGVGRWCWRDFLSDGLHLSHAGNKFVGEALVDLIDELLPNLSVKPCPITRNINSSSECKTMQRIASWHDEIDHKDPSMSFA